jgi:hypothetical protein
MVGFMGAYLKPTLPGGWVNDRPRGKLPPDQSRFYPTEAAAF